MQMGPETARNWPGRRSGQGAPRPHRGLPLPVQIDSVLFSTVHFGPASPPSWTRKDRSPPRFPGMRGDRRPALWAQPWPRVCSGTIRVASLRRSAGPGQGTRPRQQNGCQAPLLPGALGCAPGGSPEMVTGGNHGVSGLEPSTQVQGQLRPVVFPLALIPPLCTLFAFHHFLRPRSRLRGRLRVQTHSAAPRAFNVACTWLSLRRRVCPPHPPLHSQPPHS